MLYYFLFEICPCFLFFLVGGLIIYLGSIMFAAGVEIFEKANQENSIVLQKGKMEKSLAKEKVYRENFKNAKGELLY